VAGLRSADGRALDVAIAAARAAGEVALKYYRGRFDVMVKADETPVTQADREAEQVIRDTIGRAFPDHGFLGEEFGEEGDRDVRWIIDPIDGTQNFVRRIPFWAVLIALEEHGAVTAGVMLNPVSGDLFSARRGQGSFANGGRVLVSGIDTVAKSQFLHAGLRLIRETPYWDGFVRLIDGTYRQRGFGDYYGYGLVTEGKAEIYAESHVKPWDLAPAKIIVEEAGGRFTDLAGRDTIYGGNAVATNGRVHDEVIELLQPR
jgi:histidinol-phosphatase